MTKSRSRSACGGAEQRGHMLARGKEEARREARLRGSAPARCGCRGAPGPHLHLRRRKVGEELKEVAVWAAANVKVLLEQGRHGQHLPHNEPWRQRWRVDVRRFHFHRCVGFQPHPVHQPGHVFIQVLRLRVAMYWFDRFGKAKGERGGKECEGRVPGRWEHVAPHQGSKSSSPLPHPIPVLDTP